MMKDCQNAEIKIDRINVVSLYTIYKWIYVSLLCKIMKDKIFNKIIKDVVQIFLK